MKKIVFILIISGSFFAANAQSDREVVNGETFNCRTELSKNQNFDENENTVQHSTTEISNKEAETKVATKNKKHFIKKALSNFQGGDIKDAWSLLSIN